jgi:hypothetical protein
VHAHIKRVQRVCDMDMQIAKMRSIYVMHRPSAIRIALRARVKLRMFKRIMYAWGRQEGCCHAYVRGAWGNGLGGGGAALRQVELEAWAWPSILNVTNATTERHAERSTTTHQPEFFYTGTSERS